MKNTQITVDEALALINALPCTGNHPMNRSTTSDLFFVDFDESNPVVSSNGASRTLKVVFKKDNELYAFKANMAYWDEGDIDVVLDDNTFADVYDKDKSVLLTANKVIPKTRMIEQKFYDEI